MSQSKKGKSQKWSQPSSKIATRNYITKDKYKDIILVSVLYLVRYGPSYRDNVYYSQTFVSTNLLYQHKNSLKRENSLKQI